ncbi:MAG TPA: hypothetical protein VK732_07775 [Verrucomicrobiae bacterium]|nr:hypothetical protein [Verrucomicrobiae bacterium]
MDEPATSDVGDVVALSAKLGDVGALAVGEGVAAAVTTSKGAVTVVEVIAVGSPVDAEIECRPGAAFAGTVRSTLNEPLRVACIAGATVAPPSQ